MTTETVTSTPSTASQAPPAAPPRLRALRPRRNSPVREILDALDEPGDYRELEALRAAWLEEIGPERAAAELLRAMRDGIPRRRATAFAWLTQLPKVSEAAVRVSLHDARIRPYGVVWLHEMGLPGPQPTPEEVRWLYVDLLAVALDDEERFAAAAFRRVAADGSVEEQVGDVRDLWRSDHRDTEAVLGMIVRLHPLPEVAAAARQALEDARAAAAATAESAESA